MTLAICIQLAVCFAPNKSAEPPTAELFTIYQGDKMGYIDCKGDIKIPLQFDSAAPFSEGRAAVIVNGKTGLINSKGEYVLKPTYTTGIQPMSEGRAAIGEFGSTGFVNRDGQIVIPRKFVSVSEFNEGHAAAAIMDAETKFPGTAWGLIDRDGNWVIQPRFQQLVKPAEGLVPAKQDGKMGYIDKSGATKIAFKYFLTNSFSNGRGVVFTIDQKANYVKQDGEELLKTPVDMAHDFSDGMASVQKDGKWGFIDRSGKLVINYQFDSAGPFVGGLAPVTAGDFSGYIKKDGTRAFPMPRAGTPAPFEGCLARAVWYKKNVVPLYAWIDRTGKVVWEP